MVPSPLLREICEQTGALRIRLIKRRLFGFRTVVEREHVVQYYRGAPDSPPLRTAHEWERESVWNVLGRWFYLERP